MSVAIRVMVVDDTEHVRDMLATMLELDGFEVVAKVPGGEEALAAVPTAAPDVIVMDYKMPRMDGIAATRRIREVAPGVAVILYTAYLDERLERAAQEAGVAACIGKVEGLEELEKRITETCIGLLG
jgi:DNA-binding NarL/FixJ family response regulator